MSDDLRDEYDFKGGSRGRFSAKYRAGTNVVVLEPDVAEAFPNASAVNDALRALIRTASGGAMPAEPPGPRTVRDERSQYGEAPFGREWLETRGFSGFQSVASIRERSPVPSDSGVYVVVNPSEDAPGFLASSTGGFFKGRDPSVPHAELERRWIARAPVLYIGRATTLRTRIRQLVTFGAGKAVGHWGGRYLWHLADSERLLVAWRAAPDPVAAERDLLAEFREEFGAAPFANLI